MTEKYKIGAVSQIIAQASGTSQKVDPKLAALFGGSGSSVVKKSKKSVSVPPLTNTPSPTVVKVKNQSKSKEKPLKRLNQQPKFKTESQLKKFKPNGNVRLPKLDTKLKNKDAAEIRVKAKNTVRSEAANPPPLPPVSKNESNPNQVVSMSSIKNPAKRAMKKQKRKLARAAKLAQTSVQDDTISSSSLAVAATVTRKQKDEDDEVNDNVSTQKRRMIAKSNAYMRKVKKANVKKEKKEPDEDSSEEDDKDDVDIKVKVTPEISTEAIKTEKKSVVQMNTPKPKDAELEARTIYVGNLSGTLQKKALMKLFKKFGKIDTIRLRCGAPNKPYLLKKVAINSKELHPDNDSVAAYIRFMKKEDAEKAVQESKGLIIQDRHVSVDLADKSAKKDNKKAIFVGNLSLKLTDEELWEFFEECGTIENVRIIRDQATGMGKGFGYVNFEDRSAVDLAIKTKNQQNLKNRSVRVSRCVKKLKVKKTKDGRTSVKKIADKPDAESKFKRKPRHQNNADKFYSRPKHSSKPKQENVQEYTGDRLAEIGTLKRKSKKPNRGEIRKAKFVALLNKSLPLNTAAAAKRPNKRYFN